MTKEPKQKKEVEPWQAEDAARLKAIYDARPAPQLSQAEFGALHNIGSQGMVWQYLSGHRPLNIAAAVAFAQALRVTVDDFSPIIAEQISEAAKWSGRKLASVSHIQRIADDEADLLDLYRLMGADKKKNAFRAMRGLQTAAISDMTHGVRYDG